MSLFDARLIAEPFLQRLVRSFFNVAGMITKIRFQTMVRTFQALQHKDTKLLSACNLLS